MARVEKVRCRIIESPGFIRPARDGGVAEGEVIGLHIETDCSTVSQTVPLDALGFILGGYHLRMKAMAGLPGYVVFGEPPSNSPYRLALLTAGQMNRLARMCDELAGELNRRPGSRQSPIEIRQSAIAEGGA